MKLHMHDACWCNKAFLYGCAYVREIIHSLKLVDYLPVHTHKPYNNLHISIGFHSSHTQSSDLIEEGEKTCEI